MMMTMIMLDDQNDEVIHAAKIKLTYCTSSIAFSFFYFSAFVFQTHEA
jgi:hypothetical protein